MEKIPLNVISAIRTKENGAPRGMWELLMNEFGDGGDKEDMKHLKGS